MFSLLGSGTPASRVAYATPGGAGALAPGDIWARFNDGGVPSVSRAEAKELSERVALLERNVRAAVCLDARAAKPGELEEPYGCFGRRLTPLAPRPQVHALEEERELLHQSLDQAAELRRQWEEAMQAAETEVLRERAEHAAALAALQNLLSAARADAAAHLAARQQARGPGRVQLRRRAARKRTNLAQHAARQPAPRAVASGPLPPLTRVPGRHVLPQAEAELERLRSAQHGASSATNESDARAQRAEAALVQAERARDAALSDAGTLLGCHDCFCASWRG